MKRKSILGFRAGYNNKEFDLYEVLEKSLSWEIIQKDDMIQVKIYSEYASSPATFLFDPTALLAMIEHKEA